MVTALLPLPEDLLARRDPERVPVEVAAPVSLFGEPESLVDRPMHYCPGCTHGVAHRMIAEILDELRLRERTVTIASVGCSVLAMNYFNTDAQQAAHGRAPAVATGVKRARPGLIVFTYQGDGDLAAIGMGETVHAANRGEKITIVFINNAIYGMTGGQMAPTTLPGQCTTTCQTGRNVAEVGYPIRMVELLSTLQTPSFLARAAIHTPAHARRAKTLLRRAFTYQVEGTCFSLVELLSTCPTNWGMSPNEAAAWLTRSMLPAYRLGIFKTPDGPDRAPLPLEECHV